MKYFIAILFIFVVSVFAETEIFKTRARQSNTYIVAAFSEDSSFDEFYQTLNFVLSLNFPNQSELYLYSGLISHIDFKNLTLLKEIYKNSTISKNESYLNYLQERQYELLTLVELCDKIENCQFMKYNIIFLTDFYDFSKIYQYDDETIFRQIFYFSILYGNETCVTNSTTPMTCFNIFNTSISKDDVCDAIFEESIGYFFDPTVTPYNYFFVINESEIDDYSMLPLMMQQNNDFPYNGPTLFVAAIQQNDTHFYETVLVVLNINYEDIRWSLNNLVHSKSSTLSTKLVQKYLKQIYEAPQETNALKWNIVITDRFPLWIKTTNITFDSFEHQLDVYFCANNDTAIYYEFLALLNTHMNDILVKDENSTLRANHIFMIESSQEFMSNRQFFPTGKLFIPNKIYKYQSKKLVDVPWTWIIVSTVFLIIIIIGAVSGFIWRKRVQKRFREKYSWVLQAGYTSKEAEEIIENGKELFIDESFVEIDYETIQGKGSSAIVYSGLLNTESPVAIMKPSIETRGFRNCKVAIKVVSKFGRDDYEQIFREVEAGIKLGWHRHICCLLGWSIKQSAPILIYEFIEGGDLYSWVKMKGNNNEEIEEKQIAQILWQISDGMEYIASVGLVHKDLAARNIMLTNSMVAKITDFGLASSCDESFTYQAPVQRRLPIRWMAPETMTDRLFSEASDVWSFGVLAWEIFSNCEIPYGNIDGNDILEYLNAGKRLELSEGLSNKWKEFIGKCWCLEMKGRPNFKEIKFELSNFLETITESYGYVTAVTDNYV